MALSTATDTAAMLKELGVTASFSGSSTYGVLDSQDEVVLAQGGTAGAVGRLYRFTYRTAAWPSVTIGSTVTVSGTSYTVRERLAMDDGELSALLLQK